MEEMEKFKKLLGPLAKKYNEAQLLRLRREMREAADLLLDIHLWKKRHESKDGHFDGFISDA